MDPSYHSGQAIYLACGFARVVPLVTYDRTMIHWVTVAVATSSHIRTHARLHARQSVHFLPWHILLFRTVNVEASCSHCTGLSQNCGNPKVLRFLLANSQKGNLEQKDTHIFSPCNSPKFGLPTLLWIRFALSKKAWNASMFL